MTLELEDVRRLRLGPDDVLVVRLPEAAKYEDLQEAKRLLKAEFPANKVLVLAHNIDVGVVEGMWPSS